MRKSTERSPRSLREFVSRLELRDQLVRVEAEVDARLELPEIHRRVIAAGGPALLFQRVKGSPFPVVTNLYGTAERVNAAFGARPEQFVRDAARLVQEIVPPSLAKLWQSRTVIGASLRVGSRSVSRAPVAEVEEAPRLTAMPFTQSWPEDGGCFATLPIVYTEPPGGHGPPNLGIYRMHRYDDRTTGMHWQIGKGGGFHFAAAEELGAPSLKVSVFFGGPPALLLGALAPLPENVPEILLASLALGERLPLWRHKDWPHPLFAEAEWALQGHVACGTRLPEGPFGDHYGYYSLQHEYPVFECTRVLRRSDPIFPATVVGKPRQEDFYLGDYLQGLLAPLFPLVMPAVRDLWSYGETGYHSLAAAVVHERYRREAMQSAFRILGEGQLALTKFLLVVDRPCDLRDFRSLLQRVLERTNLETDLYVLANLSMDSLDYAGPRVNEGSKGVLLGLGDPVRELPSRRPSGLEATLERVEVFCPGCIVVQLGAESSRDPAALRVVAEQPALRDWPLVVVVDDARQAAASTTNFLWSVFTRFDPARDLHGSREEILHGHVVRRMPLILDARMKDGYPGELFCDAETARTVERRWKEYFPGGLEMGDSGAAHLDPPLA